MKKIRSADPFGAGRIQILFTNGREGGCLRKLREKHKGSGFFDEQVHMWAYLLATKGHDSFYLPIANRFFGKSGNRHSANGFTESPACAAASGGRNNDRDRIIRQLKKLCDLGYLGGLTEEEFQAERTKLAGALKSTGV